jgi:hypothetical protein
MGYTISPSQLTLESGPEKIAFSLFLRGSLVSVSVLSLCLLATLVDTKKAVLDIIVAFATRRAILKSALLRLLDCRQFLPITPHRPVIFLI